MSAPGHPAREDDLHEESQRGICWSGHHQQALAADVAGRLVCR
ncbi:hypothetical protein [Streptomyces noursei]|nr:hypothetical protein [Streptomyces noursei]MCZ1021404.1 hypothetical protein [Streptomyces noursei]